MQTSSQPQEGQGGTLSDQGSRRIGLFLDIISSYSPLSPSEIGWKSGGLFTASKQSQVEIGAHKSDRVNGSVSKKQTQTITLTEFKRQV